MVRQAREKVVDEEDLYDSEIVPPANEKRPHQSAKGESTGSKQYRVPADKGREGSSVRTPLGQASEARTGRLSCTGGNITSLLANSARPPGHKDGPLPARLRAAGRTQSARHALRVSVCQQHGADTASRSGPSRSAVETAQRLHFRKAQLRASRSNI